MRTLLVDGKKNVVLVDIREEVERQAAGIPELKQAARSGSFSGTLLQAAW